MYIYIYICIWTYQTLFNFINKKNAKTNPGPEWSCNGHLECADGPLGQNNGLPGWPWAALGGPRQTSGKSLGRMFLYDSNLFYEI